MGKRRTPQSLPPPPGGDGLWNQGQIPGGRRLKRGTEPRRQLRRTPGGLPWRDCVRPGGFSSLCFGSLASACGCERVQLALQLPRDLQHSHRHLQSAQPCRGPSGQRLRRHCRGPWESSLLAVLAVSPLLSAFPCRPLTPRSLARSPHPPVSPVCPPGQLLGCLLQVSLLVGTAVI